MTRTFSAGITGGGIQFAVDKVISAPVIIEVEQALLGATDDQEIPVAFAADELVYFAAYCDKACTLETNSGSAPGNTITLPAGTLYVWDLSLGGTNPFTATPVTGLFASIAGATAATLKVLVALDGAV